MTNGWCDLRCKNQVGIGSNSRDLAGAFFSRLTISVTVAGLKSLISGTCRTAMVGGSADDFDVRILSTLPLENE